MAMRELSVWVVDDDESVRWVLEQALKQAQMLPRCFESGEAFFRALDRERPDVIVTDIRMPDMTGLELMAQLTAQNSDIPVIVITAHSDLDNAVSAYQGGAFEYLPKPFDIDKAVELISRAARQRGEVTTSDRALRSPRIIGQAPAMQEVFRAIGRLSRSSMTVLITGESGTGKEIAARAIHYLSPLQSGPFVAIDCGGNGPFFVWVFPDSAGLLVGSSRILQCEFLRAVGYRADDPEHQLGQNKVAVICSARPFLRQ